MDKILMTKDGFEKMRQELEHLKKVERPAVIQSIADAREHGDLKENAEYHAAKEKQSFIEGRILELGSMATRAEVIDLASITGDVVRFGATVKIVDEETEEENVYQLVSEYEADFKQGKISIFSPMAKALMNKKSGDSIEFKSPKGMKYLEIISVKYK